MSAVLIGVKYKSDKRDQYLHHGGWLVKLGLWLTLCILPFFFPVGLVNAYCESTFPVKLCHPSTHFTIIVSAALQNAGSATCLKVLQRQLCCAAWLARFGSGLFMVVQMIILLDMTQNWNDDWVAKEDERCAHQTWSHCCVNTQLPADKGV